MNWISGPWFSGCWMLNNQFSFVLKIDYRSAASSYCWWCGTSVIHSLQLDCSTVFAPMCYYLQLHTIQVFSSCEQVTLLHATFSYRILLQASYGREGLFDWTLKKCLRQATSLGLQFQCLRRYCWLKLQLLLAKNWGLLFTNERIFKSRGGVATFGYIKAPPLVQYVFSVADCNLFVYK